MSEPLLVDVAYRTLPLGTTVRLRDLASEAGGWHGFVELDAPLPVGTTLMLQTENGVALGATVTRVVEADAAAGGGMRLRFAESAGPPLAALTGIPAAAAPPLEILVEATVAVPMTLPIEATLPVSPTQPAIGASGGEKASADGDGGDDGGAAGEDKSGKKKGGGRRRKNTTSGR